MAAIPEEPVMSVAAGLFAIFALVLILPFKVKKVEQNLEPFFLIMGVAAVTISGLWNLELIEEAVKAPVITAGIPLGIFQVVLVAGLLIHYFDRPFYEGITLLARRLGPRVFIFVIITLLGLCSSVISVIVTAVILAEVVVALPFQRNEKTKITVIACFALGLGAALTPVGEPLSTIVVHKLAGPPYNADFFFLFMLLGIYICIGIISLAIFAAEYIGKKASVEAAESQRRSAETVRNIALRAVKVYLFVGALVLLGTGLTPLIIWYFSKVPAHTLYWVNIVSAVVDNATLAAAEIGPTLSVVQIKSALMGLLVAGGMLVPGNIPNIVAAARLKITMKEWASFGVPLGLVLMVAYFVALAPLYFS